MHYRIFSILVTFVCLFGCALTTAAQDVNNTDETEKPVILYSGTPKKYEIADIKVEGAQNYEDYVIVGLSGLSKGRLSPCRVTRLHKLVSATGATVCSLTWKLQQTRLKATKFG